MPIVLPDVDTLRAAIGSAVRAPSVYNSQPWRWRTGPAGVDLFADPGRQLIVIDPDGRDLLLSCGGALHHLVVALAGAGWSAQVDHFPDPEDSEHLARVRPLAASPAADTARLAPAIAHRRTDRRRFSDHPVDRDVLDLLARRAAESAAQLHVVAGGRARTRLLGLLTRSESLQRQQAGYAAEMTRWTSRHTDARDGVAADAVPAGIGRPAEVPMRGFAQAELRQSPHSFEHEDASVLLVLSSLTDDRLGALRAGEATSAVLLAATDLGLATTPLSQPLEVAATRAAISEHIVGPQLFPQILLRIGWAQPDSRDLPPTPRRSLRHVLREG